MARQVFDVANSEGAITALIPDPSGGYILPDSASLFRGTFDRSGSDLIISNDAGARFYLKDYFASDVPADIHDENGAVLRGDIVARLAGPLTPGQYADLSGQVGGNPIGQVETLEGAVSATRADGSVEPLQLGSKIYEQDVIETAQGATVSVTFVDGTIFSLASASRMLIDELVYDPGSTDNSGGFSLVQGSFVFIAGQVAKTGGMDVSTPASTMGIRGTTVIVQVATQDGVVTSEITLTNDPDGDVGLVELRDAEGSLIANITETDVKWIVSTGGGVTRELARTTDDLLEDSVLIAEAFAAYRAAVARVDAGDTFVTLSDPGTSVDSNNAGADAPTDLEVDSVDEPDAIDPLNDVEEAPEPEGITPYDEGLNLLEGDIETPELIIVEGFEDATEDTAIAGNVSVQNAEGLTLVFALGSTPDNGTATVNPDGSFAFVPDPNFNGTDDFTFTVTGSDGATGVGTVRVEVLPVNDAPTTADTSASMTEDGIVSGTIDAQDIDGDVLDFTISGLPSHGEVLLFPNGNYTYTPDANFEGTDSFSVTVSDVEGVTAGATVTITVAGENDVPVILTTIEDAARALTEVNTAASVGGTLVADDPDAGETLTWLGAQSGAYGDFAVDASGNWTYTLVPARADQLTPGQQETETFTATVRDQAGFEDTIDVSITVTGTNDLPQMDVASTVAEGALVEGAEIIDAQGLLQADDPDLGDTVTWTAGAVTAALGVFTLSAGGAWTYQLDNALADSLQVGDAVVETLVAEARDENGGLITKTIEVTIQGTNDAPIVSASTVFETVENTGLTGSLSATDIDGALADLTFSLGSLTPQNGTVTINPDGSFTYQPDVGFLGVEKFEYVVEDGAGGTSVALATIEVESDPDDEENQNVSVGLNTVATPDTAAGAVEIVIDQSESTSVKLAIALDRSGSIGSNQWAEMLQSVKNALTELATQFEGSSTSVEVQIITFATDVDTTEPLDLLADKTELLNLLDPAVLTYNGGFTAWNLAFQKAGEFFFEPDNNVPNYLLFVTDGFATNGTWVEPLEDLQNPNDDYDVTINAFGFGNNFILTDLRTIDPNAVFLADSSLLAEAFTATPIFNPDLVSFQIELEADGGPAEVIADETTPELIIEGTDYELPLASIADIFDKLGAENRISVTAQFDINKDPSNVEIDIFSTDLIGKADTEQTSVGLAGHDLLFGSDLSDDMSGGAGNDILISFDGDDTLDGGAGADSIRAGAGDDKITVSDMPVLGDVIEGGDGRDTLAIETLGSINEMLANLDMTGMEVLDIDNGLDEVFTLTFEEIAGFSDTSDGDLEALLGAALQNGHTVYGNVNDVLTLDAASTYGITEGGPVTASDGTELNIYTFTQGGNALATLGVDSDINVIVENAVIA